MTHRCRPILIATTVVGLLLLTSPPAHAVLQSDSSTEDFRISTFIANPGADSLETESAARGGESFAPGDEIRRVSFGIDQSETIVSKEIGLERFPLPNTEGRDKLAGYIADESGRVELSWWDPSAGEIDWTIKRDDVIIATTIGDTYVDTRDPELAATYTVEGTRAVEVDGGVAEEPFSAIIDVPALDLAPIGQPFGPSALQASSNTDVFVALGVNWGMSQELNTFIPTAVAGTPFNLQPCLQAWGAGDLPGYYAGDNRGFSGPTVVNPSVRTGLRLTSTYNSMGNSTGWSWLKRTSGSKLYSSNGVLVAQANAVLNIQNTGGRGDETGGMGTFSHHVSDPLCFGAPAIDYELTIGAWGNGGISLSGWHDQAPSYEFRVRTGSTDYHNFYEFTNQGLQYLLPQFPKAHVDISGGVSPN